MLKVREMLSDQVSKSWKHRLLNSSFFLNCPALFIVITFSCRSKSGGIKIHCFEFPDGWLTCTGAAFEAGRGFWVLTRTAFNESLLDRGLNEESSERHNKTDSLSSQNTLLTLDTSERSESLRNRAMFGPTTLIISSIWLIIYSMELTKVAFCLFLATVALEFLPRSQVPEPQGPDESVQPSPYKGKQSLSKLKGTVIIEYW